MNDFRHIGKKAFLFLYPVRPRKLAICPVKMVIAIPVVKPMVTGRGMYFIKEPSLNTPIRTKMICYKACYE